MISEKRRSRKEDLHDVIIRRTFQKYSLGRQFGYCSAGIVEGKIFGIRNTKVTSGTVKEVGGYTKGGCDVMSTSWSVAPDTSASVAAVLWDKDLRETFLGLSATWLTLSSRPLLFEWAAGVDFQSAGRTTSLAEGCCGVVLGAALPSFGLRGVASAAAPLSSCGGVELGAGVPFDFRGVTLAAPPLSWSCGGVRLVAAVPFDFRGVMLPVGMSSSLPAMMLSPARLLPAWASSLPACTSFRSLPAAPSLPWPLPACTSFLATPSLPWPLPACTSFPAAPSLPWPMQACTSFRSLPAAPSLPWPLPACTSFPAAPKHPWPSSWPFPLSSSLSSPSPPFFFAGRPPTVPEAPRPLSAPLLSRIRAPLFPAQCVLSHNCSVPPGP